MQKRELKAETKRLHADELQRQVDRDMEYVILEEDAVMDERRAKNRG